METKKDKEYAAALEAYPSKEAYWSQWPRADPRLQEQAAEVWELFGCATANTVSSQQAKPTKQMLYIPQVWTYLWF
jgi:type IV pilus biogenesis protein CpaD/CtpE